MIVHHQKFFAPNSHSDFLIRWHEVMPEKAVLIKEVLKKNYALGEVVKIEQVEAMEVRSNNFRVTLETGMSRLQIILRKNIQQATLSALAAVSDFIKVARAAGLPAPELLLSKDGREIVESAGWLWQVFAYIPGNYYQGKENELAETATVVAQLHKAFVGIAEDRRLESPHWKLLTAADFSDIFLAAKNDDSELGALVRENEQVMNDTVRELSSRALAINKEPTQIIHADLHPHNFLFDKGHLTALLDFGDVRSGIRAADAASACHRLVRQYIVHSGRPWREVLKHGLSVFISNYQKIFPLSVETLTLFPEFMTLALLRKIKGNLIKYFQKKPHWTRDIAHQEFIKQINLLAEVRAMKEFFNFCLPSGLAAVGD